MNISLNEQEVKTVLAALIFYAANFDDTEHMREEMSHCFETFEPLNHEEIHSLCNKIAGEVIYV